jgi:hypothetical protein
MKPRVLLLRWSALVVFVGVGVMLTGASASAKKPPPPPAPGSSTSTYVKNYANLVNGAETSLTPEDVVATPDGGWTALAIASAGAELSWLVNASAFGKPQWQEEIGCLNGAPGDYADGVSLQRTSDGGYVLAGGTVGCGSGSVCPELSGLQCGLIEKLDSTGAVVWARVYAATADGTAFTAIRQTGDGGFVAVGTGTDASQRPGALIVKLDGSGNVQWQRQLGPTSTSYALFETVQPTSDGGYLAAGEFNDGSTSSLGLPLMSVLAVKFDAAGNIVWQHGFNDFGATGVTATEHVHSLVQTSDGGYAIGGDWNDSSSPGTCCQGALLLRLTPAGTIQWQQAYSGGVYCFFNGYSETCNTIGGGVYSLHQTTDGGYQLAGDSNLELSDETPLVPWLAKVDANGAHVWQEQDYQSLPSTGRPLSEYFAASTLTPAGPVAIGSTENYSNGRNELLGVQTDTNGAVGACSQIHPASTLAPVNPGLAQLTPGFTGNAGTTSDSSSPVHVQPTTTTATASQC